MQNWASTKANKYKNKQKRIQKEQSWARKDIQKARMSPEEAKRTEIWANKSKHEQKNAPKRAKQKRKIKKKVNKSKKKCRQMSQKEPKKTNKSTNGQKWSDFFVFYCFLISFLLHPWEPIHIHNLPPHTTHITLGELRQRRIMLAKTCEPNGSHRVLFFPRKLCSKARSKAVCLKSMFRGKCLSKALLTAHWSV